MSQVIIGMADENLVADLMSLLEEMDGFTVRAVAKSPTELVDLASRLEPDVVFVHETLGIEPVSQTIRDLANRRPSTAVIQVSQIRTPALVIKAMEDGARGVVAYPFAYEDVSTRVIAAAEWSEHMKAVLADIQSGAFAKRFIADQDAGAPEFLALREKGAAHPIEATGQKLRALFAWKQQDADYVEGSAAR